MAANPAGDNGQQKVLNERIPQHAPQTQNIPVSQDDPDNGNFTKGVSNGEMSKSQMPLTNSSADRGFRLFKYHSLEPR